MALSIGPLHVRRSVLINASPSRVWRHFETTEHIMAWLNLGHTVHTFEPRLGGAVEMSVEIEGEQQHFGGVVLVYEAEQELSFTSQWKSGPLVWPVPTFWTARLTPWYDGTLVEIFHHGFERMGANAADELQGYEEGWDTRHVNALRALAEAA